MRLARSILGIWGSLAGRLALLLTLGMGLVAAGSLLMAQWAHLRELSHFRTESVGGNIADIAHSFATIPDTTATALAAGLIRNIRPAPAGARIDHASHGITTVLAARLGPQAQAIGQIKPHTYCFPPGTPDAGIASGWDAIPDCWLVRFRDPRGVQRLLLIGLPHYLNSHENIIDPLYLAFILIMSASLATGISWLAIHPLRQLTAATETFSLAEDPTPLPETGPTEVRTAIATFNLMQKRVSEGHRERTGMLAAISHDLQTPLTRLQLRLDDVADPALHARLGADLAIMQSMVREGLELARSTDNREPWSVVDIDSLLASIAADAVELGLAVEIGRTSGLTISTKVDALTRCLTNLVENAVKYGTCARIDCAVTPHMLEIHVTDEGPGIPPGELDRVFEPFARGEQSRSRATGGTGLGLTIARAQAKALGGDVRLDNREGGGLVATVRIGL